MELWKILVPTQWLNPHCKRKGTIPVTTRHHKNWDAKMIRLCGGLTILSKVKGRWANTKGGVMVAEDMIEVLLAANRFIIEKAIDITKSHYNQEAVMAYKISNEVMIQ